MLVFGGILLAPDSARAALINVTLDWPRAQCIDVSVNYDADGGPGSLGLLTVEGAPDTLLEEAAGSPRSMSIWDYTDILRIEVVIDPNSRQAVSGKLELVGDPYTAGVYQTLFYSEKLWNFGYGAFGYSGDDLMEFIFIQQGTGMVVPDGEQIGVILKGVSIDDATLFGEQTLPTFLDDFSNNMNNGICDVGYVPEPATVALLALGACLPLLRRRTRLP
jgi:hypothetical protein